MNAKIELIKLLEEKKLREKKKIALNQWNSLYDWQKEFIKSTSDHTSSCLMAANRVGKTRTGLLCDAIHLLGDYPEDWTGHKFDNPPLMWLLGVTGEKTRDLLQTPLFGTLTGGEFSGGLVPKDRIINYKSMTGTAGAVREVRVKNKNGVAVIQFWSYSQGQSVLMGDSVDWFHIDEEPKDQTIFPQVLTRTATGDQGKGGRGILTFTPENGRTDLVINFMDNPANSQFFMQKGWDDAPHLSDEVKESLLDQYPEHQRDMRSKGVPMLGHGRIYDIADEFVLCDPFPIPDHFFVINGLDFGYDHPQAHCQLAHDRDNDMIYVTHSWKQSKVSANDAWGAVNNWAKQIPYAWPHDGLQKEKGRDDSTQLKDHYVAAGFKMLAERATFVNGSNSVENGIYEIIQLIRKGKFKVFAGQADLMDEFRQYHRDPNGKIVKVRDDILDAVRYAYMMLRYAVQYGEIFKQKKVYIPKPMRTIGKR